MKSRLLQFTTALSMLMLLAFAGSSAFAGSISAVDVGGQSTTWLSTSTTFPVTVTRTGSLTNSDDFQMSISGLPAGVSASFSPSTFTMSGSTQSSRQVTLTLTVTGNPPQGNDNFTVTATQTDVNPDVSRTDTGTAKIDTVDPTTSASITGGTLGNNGYYKTAVTVNITASETASASASGLNGRPKYKVDGGAQADVPVNGNITVSGDNVNHVVEYWAVDIAGNEAAHKTLTFKIDGTSPVVSSITPAHNSLVNGTMTLAATVADLDMLSVEFIVGGRSMGVDTDGTNGWGVTVTPNPALATGNNNYTVVALDKAGNAPTSPATQTLRVDVTAPNIGLTSPGVGVKVSGTQTLTVGSADTNPGRVEFYLDGALVGTDNAPNVSSWSFDLNTTTFTDGVHLWHAKAIDAAGNSITSGTRTIEFDNVTPTVALSSPADNALFTNPQTLTATATGATSVEFYVDNVLVGTDSNATGGWTFSLDTTSLVGTSHTWKATAKDVNSSVTSASRNFTLDRTPPVVAAVSPGDNLFVNSTTTTSLTLTATATDASMDRVEFYIDSTLKGTDTTPSGSTYSASASLTGVPAGAHTWTAKAIDTSGNSSTSSLDFTIDNTAPVVNSMLPALDTVIGATVTLSATVTDPNMASVEFRLGSPAFTATDNDGSDGWSVTVTHGRAQGNNAYTVRATDKAGNVGQATIARLVVDTTAPTVTLVTPNNNVEDNGSVTFTVSSSDSNDNRVEFYLDGQLVGTDTVDSPANSWSVTIDGSDFSDGTHTWTAKGIDDAGNSFTAATRTIRFDNFQPAITLTSPANGQDVTGTINLTATATNTDEVEFFINGVSKGTDTDGSNGWSVSVDTTTLAEGNRTWNAVARDDQGNDTSSATFTMVVDNAPPVVNATSPAEGAVLRSSASPTLTATATDANMSRVEFYLDGVLKGSDTNISDSTFTRVQSLAGLTEGAHTWAAKAFDDGGRSSTDTVNFTIDNTAPVFTSLSPANSTKVGATMTLSAVVTDPNMASVEFRVGSVAPVYSVTDNDGSDGWSVTVTPNPRLASGNHNYTAIATDKAGNTTTKTPVQTLSIDNTAPAVALASPNNDAFINGPINLIATATDNFAVTEVRFFVDGTQVGVGTNTSGNSWSYNYSPIGLTDGDHPWFARAYDEAGNFTNSSTRTLKVDTTSPNINLNFPSNNAFVSGTSSLLLVSASDADPQKVEFYIDGILVGTDNSSFLTLYSYSLNTTTLTEGDHLWNVKAYDDNGNVTTTPARTIRVDNAAPALALASPAADAHLRSTVAFSATASDAYLEKVEFYIDGTLRGNGTNNAGTYSFSFNTATLTAGSHNWHARATDLSGKSTTVATRAFVVDNTVPTVSLTAPAHNVAVAKNIDLTATAADTNLDKVEFYIDGTLRGTGTSSAGTFTYQVDTTSLTDGSHSWYAKAIDLAGNATSAAARNIIVDNTAPTVTTTSPANNALVSGVITLRATSTDLRPDRVEFTMNSVSLGTGTLAAGVWSITFDTATLADGTYTWSAKGFDTLGNNATSSRTIRVDNAFAPTMAAVGDKTTDEDTPVAAFDIAVNDVDAGDTMTVTGTSDNTTLIPNANIVITPATGTATTRSVTITPAANQSGTANVTLTVSDGALSSTRTFLVTVNPVNDAPTVNNPASPVGLRDNAGQQTITLTGVSAGAPDESGQTLTITATSDNHSLIPDPTVGAIDNGTVDLTFTPVTDATGTAIITVVIDDGQATNNQTTRTITVVVSIVDNPPSISDTSNKTTLEDTATPAIDFTVGDDRTALNALTVTATSSNTSLVTNANVVLGGTGADRTVTLTPEPNASGTTTITISVNDGTNTTTDTFELAVTAVNDAPVTVADGYNVDEDTTLNVNAPGVLANDTDVENSTLTAELVSAPATGTLTLNANGSFSYVPVANATGAVTFTYRANDGTEDGNTETVTINLGSTNDLPTIGAIANLSTAQEVPTGDIELTVGDAETDAANLTLSATSSNPNMVLPANMVFGGTGANRTLKLTPTQTYHGNTTITVKVTDADGSTATSAFVLTVIPRPVIAGFNPVGGAGIGLTVNISGSFFTGATAVSFNNVPAIFTLVAPTLINAIVPLGATTGQLRVTTPGGTGISANNFNLIAAPQVGSFSPNEGAYGDEITISGNNLDDVTMVQFNGFTTTNITQISEHQIRVTVPTGATSGKITVFTHGGQDTSEDTFTVYPLPQIGNFSPNIGNIGTQVNISGSHLASTQLVRFNTQHTTAFTVLNNNSISVLVPPGATTGKITIETKGGIVISDDTFTVVLAPSISTFSPSGGSPGTMVTLSGNNLSNVSIAFNGVPAASITPVSSFQVRAVVPAGATTGRITATSSGGTGISATDFVVASPPVISSLSVNNGQAGTGVVISGSNFSGATSVKFNGVAAVFTVNSASQITTTVPVGATTGKVSVTTVNGTGLSPQDFVIDTGTAAPIILGFSPTSGAAGSTVVITGTGFLGATSVTFAGATAPVSANFRIDSAQKITATVPANTVTGPISVTTAGGMGSSTSSFTIVRFPVIFSFTPVAGMAGTSVTITGANFTGVTAVRFAAANGATVTAPFTPVNATQLRFNVPLTAITGKISVTNGFGTGQTDTDFLVGPRIDSFTPTSGPVGTTVTINGRAFTGATAVQFNGELAQFTVVSATQITAKVPAGASSGVITVTTPSGLHNSAATFTVTP